MFTHLVINRRHLTDEVVMFTHRFQSHVSNRLPTLVGVSVNCAFVPCPMFNAFPASQQAQIQEVYRTVPQRRRVSNSAVARVSRSSRKTE